MSEATERAGAFFGRRKGKKLRAGQDDLVQNLLPAIRVTPGSAPASLFPDRQARETWLEIGRRLAPTRTSISSAASPS
jgi:tRNA (guanine-N7-)-methyltransferase